MHCILSIFIFFVSHIVVATSNAHIAQFPNVIQPRFVHTARMEQYQNLTEQQHVSNKPTVQYLLQCLKKKKNKDLESAFATQ